MANTITIGINVDTSGMKWTLPMKACLYGAAVLNYIGFKRITSGAAARWIVRHFLETKIEGKGETMTARFVNRPLFG